MARSPARQHRVQRRRPAVAATPERAQPQGDQVAAEAPLPSPGLSNQATQRHLRAGVVPVGLVQAHRQALGNRTIQRLARANGSQAGPAVDEMGDQHEQERKGVAGSLTPLPAAPAPSTSGGHGGATVVQRAPLTAEEQQTDLTLPLLAGNPRLQAAFDNNPPLRPGEKGEAVRLLQRALLDLGFALPISTRDGAPDGDFGGETVTAVEEFQDGHNLAADGVVGRNTLRTLQVMLAGPAASASPGPQPATGGATFAEQLFFRPGPRFDAVYTPVGPAPATGTLEIQLRVHITFRNFSAAMMFQEPFRSHKFTPEQKADFKWTKAEQDAFKTDFAASVHDGWSEKHELDLNEAGFGHHRSAVAVNVEIVDDPTKAHNRMTAQKVPTKGGPDNAVPRFRSSVSGNTSTLEIRDATEEETFEALQRQLVRQVKPFGNDSADLTPELETQIQKIEDDMKRLNIALGPNAKGELWHMAFRGRASSTGTKEHNEDLGRRRAEAVQAKVNADLGLGTEHEEILTAGEENASTGETFRRVDISVVNRNPAQTDTVSLNTAAHEAGHMFGLGDEYVEEEKGGEGRFFGDEPSHYGDVEALMGVDAANELLVEDSGSMMSRGSEVKRGHYVYFLQAINEMTARRWTVG